MRKKTGHNNASWEIIEGLGRTGNSVSVLPVTLPAIDNEKDIVMNSPLLEYDIYTFSEGAFPVVFNCIPSSAINEEYGLRIAVAVDDNLPEIVSNIESHDVIENLMKLKTNLNIKTKEPHVLKVYMVDPGVVIDKIVIETGALKDSYLGPPASKYYELDN